MKQRLKELLEEIRLMHEDRKCEANYFTRDEHNETLRAGQTLADENFVTRDYTYKCSGATYTG